MRSGSRWTAGRRPGAQSSRTTQPCESGASPRWRRRKDARPQEVVFDKKAIITAGTDLIVSSNDAGDFRLLATGAAKPGDSETNSNPRARSAKLRVARRTAAPALALDPSQIDVPQLSTKGRR